MNNQLIGKVPFWLVKFVTKKILRRKLFSYNRVKPPTKKWDRFKNFRMVYEENRQVSLILENAEIQLGFLSPEILHFKLSKKSEDIQPSWVIDQVDYSPIRLLENEKKIEISNEASRLNLEFDKQNSSVTIQTDSGVSLFKEQIFSYSTTSEWYKTNIIIENSKKTHFYGLGENTGVLDKRNQTIGFWNTDSFPYGDKENNLYQSQPILIVAREDGFCYAIVFDNPNISQIKNTKIEKALQTEYTVKGGGLDFFVILGDKPHSLLEKITNLLGKAPLPPLSTLGNHQCKWSYYPESQVREVAQTFRNKNIPCDFIHLDIDYLDGYRIFTWDKERFPEPKKLANDLKEQGFKLMSMTDPGVKVDPDYHVYQEGVEHGHFCQNPDSSLYSGIVWPGLCHFPDFTQEKTRKWFGEHFSVLTENGVKGFWIDMNEPSVFSLIGTAPDSMVHPHEGKPLKHSEVHNVYGHLMAKATYEGIQKLLPNQRIFVLTRAAYLGTQKYSGSWTGDNNAEWEHLRYSLPMLMNMACSGQMMIGPDIGGFGGKPKEELLIRWYQAGLFYPFFRNHSINDACSHEPWKYSTNAENIIKDTIQLRYQLMLYIYNEIRKTTETGVPAFRAMWIDYPEEKKVYNKKWSNSQYLFGSSLLIAPILKQGREKRKVYLPKGVWYDFWSGERYEGGEKYTFKVPIDKVLIFVKSGSMIPFIEKKIQYTEELFNSPITLRLYGNSHCEGEVYLDDGVSLGFQKGDYEHIYLKAQLQENVWNIRKTLLGEKGKYIQIQRAEHIGNKETEYNWL